jgi:hypothetical protein
MEAEKPLCLNDTESEADENRRPEQWLHNLSGRIVNRVFKAYVLLLHIFLLCTLLGWGLFSTNLGSNHTPFASPWSKS